MRMSRLKTVESLDEIPEFRSEAEEAEFWGSHELSDELLAQMKAPPERVRPRPGPHTKSVTRGHARSGASSTEQHRERAGERPSDPQGLSQLQQLGRRGARPL